MTVSVFKLHGLPQLFWNLLLLPFSTAIEKESNKAIYVFGNFSIICCVVSLYLFFLSTHWNFVWYFSRLYVFIHIWCIGMKLHAFQAISRPTDWTGHPRNYHIFSELVNKGPFTAECLFNGTDPNYYYYILWLRSFQWRTIHYNSFFICR